jgi:hypothetical protein
MPGPFAAFAVRKVHSKMSMERAFYQRTLASVLVLAASVSVAPDAGASGAERGTIRRGFHHQRSPSLFAVVDSAGGLVHGSDVSSVTHLGTGQYEVTFGREVGRCAYLATPANAYSQAITAFTAGGHLSSQGVYVETKNQGGGLTDGPFHLVVVCGGDGSRYAVVGYGADLVRATRGTTLTPLGFGRYQVRFPHRFEDFGAACAYLATVGDPDDALVFSPAGVYTGSGPDSRTVYVETKNPGGGLQDGVPFHLAVVCSTAPRTRVAVVQADGIARRSSIFTSSFGGAVGNYSVVTNRDLSACATVATRGSVGRDVPFSPATLEIVPGPAINTVGLQVRQLLFFGGAFANEAFHSATFCE